MIAQESRSGGLTTEQNAPLDVVGASVALGAGAGCGKTTVLTARFLRDLGGDAPIPLDAIVALTFTEKAARELRKRIRGQCRDRLASGSDPGRWRAVLRGLEAAPIGTFHEFCGHWLRRRAVAAGIDPDFAILDESIAGSVRDEAVARCLRRGLVDLDPDLIGLAVEFGLGPVRQAIGELLPERSSGGLADWEARTPEEVVRVWEEAWLTRGRPALGRKLVRAAVDCLELLAREECTHPRMIERRAILLEELPRLIGGEGLGADEDGALLAIRERAKVQGGGTRAHWSSPAIHAEVGDRFSRLRKAIDDFRDRSRWDPAATLEAAAQGLRLARLVLRARREYEAAKRARGGLDFDDLLLKTRDLLRRFAADPEGEGAGTPPPARILVDEFQDTDPVQAEILDRLAGAESREGRLFLVGDPKQSIYRFRGARPEIFRDAGDLFPAGGRLHLTENFRSVPAILDFVNHLFDATFPEPNPALLPRRPPHAGGDAAVEFLWATEPEGVERPKASAHDRRVLEARWLARRLRQRIDAGWIIRDPRDGRSRPAGGGDVAFLFRAMTDVGPYESALLAEGFEYYTLGGAAYYAQQEVHDLINLLSVIEDPLNAIALAGALRGPFFCLGDEGLFWLATPRNDLVEGLRDPAVIAELSPRDRDRAIRARDLLERWRSLKDREPIATLLNRILEESGYEAALLGEALGTRKRANARKLVRLARRFDQQGGFTLGAFVSRLRADLRQPPREEQAATTDEEGASVRLLSIHQSKGLEFPIVVVPDLNRRPPARLDAVAFHPDLGPLVRPSKDQGADATDTGDEPRRSLGWLAYQAIEQREDDAEAHRLFYVATTRARDALILSAGIGPEDLPVSPAMVLLDDRFNRRDGRPRRPSTSDRPIPEIRVTTELPPRQPGTAMAPSHADRLASLSQTLLEAATIIEQAVPFADPPPVARRRPAFVDLDPSKDLLPSALRVDRLVREALGNPGIWGPGDWADLATRAMRRADPLATPAAIDEALGRLDSLRAGPARRPLAEASVLEAGRRWTVSWPCSPGGPATVFSGTADLIARQPVGTAVVLNFSDPAASTPREVLRLLLSMHAIEATGAGAIEHGERIVLGRPHRFDRIDLADMEAIEAAVRGLWP